MPRVLLFTGKGGVGKTTCAAATALACARRGQRTLVLSTDPAHSLADAVDRPLGPEPRSLAPDLDAMEVDLYYSMRKYWGNMRELVRAVLRFQGADAIAAEELAALPGMGEGSALLWLDEFVRSGDYDVIVLDAAPTGETLTLLTLPQVTQWWLQKAFPLQKTAIKTVGFAVRKTTGVPLDKGYEELDRLFGKLGDVQEILQDPEVTSARLVMNPERMVIQEAKRAYTYLQLYGYGVDAAVVNRVIPRDEAGGVMAKYVEAQAGYLDEIERSFAPLPVLQVPHLGEEVFGLELLGADRRRPVRRPRPGGGLPLGALVQGRERGGRVHRRAPRPRRRAGRRRGRAVRRRPRRPDRQPAAKRDAPGLPRLLPTGGGDGRRRLAPRPVRAGGLREL